MQWLGPLVRLLELLARIWDRIRKRERREQHREEEQQLQDDPVGFGDEFFNGVQSDAGPDARVPPDAPGADPAKPAQLDPERSGRGKPQ